MGFRFWKMDHVESGSEKTDELPPPEPTYVEDPTLDPGTEVTQKAATNGSRWVTYKIVSKNGTVVEKTEDQCEDLQGTCSCDPQKYRNREGFTG